MRALLGRAISNPAQPQPYCTAESSHSPPPLLGGGRQQGLKNRSQPSSPSNSCPRAVTVFIPDDAEPCSTSSMPEPSPSKERPHPQPHAAAKTLNPRSSTDAGQGRAAGRRWHWGAGSPIAARQAATAALVLTGIVLLGVMHQLEPARHAGPASQNSIVLSLRGLLSTSVALLPRHSLMAPAAAAHTLVVYIYSNSDPEYESNLRFFVREAMSPDDGCEYVIVVQEGEGVDPTPMLPPLPPNARYEFHENRCFDWGTFGWLFWEQRVQPQRYRYIVFMNSSTRGPFLPPYWPAGQHWSTAFTSRLTEDVKLVGSTISCEATHKDGDPQSEKRQNAHVQSYAMATDLVGLDVLLRNGSVFKCYETIHDTIWHAELGASLAILGAGYNLDSLMLRYQGIDWRDRSFWNCNAGDNPYKENSLDGVNLNPLEVLFVKVKGYLLDLHWSVPRAAAAYDRWLATRGRKDAITANAFADDAPAYRKGKEVEMALRGRRCFDYGMYRRKNGDIPASMSEPALWEHFLQYGQFEGRPFRFQCDMKTGWSPGESTPLFGPLPGTSKQDAAPLGRLMVIQARKQREAQQPQESQREGPQQQPWPEAEGLMPLQQHQQAEQGKQSQQQQQQQQHVRQDAWQHKAAGAEQQPAAVKLKLRVRETAVNDEAATAGVKPRLSIRLSSGDAEVVDVGAHDGDDASADTLHSVRAQDEDQDSAAPEVEDGAADGEAADAAEHDWASEGVELQPHGYSDYDDEVVPDGKSQELQAAAPGRADQMAGVGGAGGSQREADRERSSGSGVQVVKDRPRTSSRIEAAKAGAAVSPSSATVAAAEAPFFLPGGGVAV